MSNVRVRKNYTMLGLQIRLFWLIWRKHVSIQYVSANCCKNKKNVGILGQKFNILPAALSKKGKVWIYEEDR